MAIDPQTTYVLLVALMGVLGLMVGLMPSRTLAAEFFVPGLWAILFILNPSWVMAAAIVGYFAGFGFRLLRARASAKDESDNTPPPGS